MPTSSRRTHLPVFALISAALLAGCRGDGTQARPDSAETTPANSSAAGAEASPERMAHAAREFLDALSPQQRADAEFPFDADSERTRWSNLPASMVERAGVRFGDLTDGQRRRFHNLLRASTSSQGYQKIAGVIGNCCRRSTRGSGRLRSWAVRSRATYSPVLGAREA